MTATTAKITTTNKKEYHGVPIGAIRINCTKVQDLRNLIVRTLEDPKVLCFRGTEKLEQGMILLHLPPSIATLFMDQHVELIHFLHLHEGVFLPGVRRPRPCQQPLSIDIPCVPPKQKKRNTGGTNNFSRFTFVELFAGIGGFRLGLELLGGNCILASELRPQATKIYRQYFGQDEHLVEGDILDLCDDEIPNEFTILTGGFPCQPFSNRGMRRGLEDDRGQLYQEMVRVLRTKRPPLFLFENVAGLVTMDGGSRGKREPGRMTKFKPGAVMEKMLQAFRDCGYKVEWQIVNARHFVPQYRERVYFVGSRLELNCKDFTWESIYPKQKPPALIEILEPTSSPAIAACELSPSQWEKVQSLDEAKEEKMLKLNDYAPTLISSYHKVGSFSNKYVGEERDGTLRDGLGGHSRPRFLTPRECCRIMGFPEDFPVPLPVDDAAHFYQGIGNAVVPAVITAIGEQMMMMYECALGSSNESPP